MPRADFRLHRRSRWPIGSVQTDQRSPRACPQALRRPTNRGRHPEHPRGCTQPAAHPAAKCQNGRRLPARRSGRECTGRSPPTPIRARRAPSARPTKGGAVRIRIALATAVAVIAIPAVLLTLFSSTPAASARVARHEAVSQRRAVKIDSKLMSFAQAEKVAKLATYSNAVAAQQQSTYLKDVAFLTYLKDVSFMKAVALQQQQAAQQAAAQQAAARPAPAPAAAPAPPPPPAAGVSDATSTDTADWACIRQHESGGDYSAGDGGAYQFEFRDVDSADRAALPRGGLSAGGTGCRSAEAVLAARLGALDHAVRLRAVRNRARDGSQRAGTPNFEDDTEQPPKRAVHNRPHTLRRKARTDDAFPLSVRGANAMAGARPHRAEPGASSRARRREVPCGSALHSRRRWPSLL